MRGEVERREGKEGLWRKLIEKSRQSEHTLQNT